MDERKRSVTDLRFWLRWG